MNAHLKKPIDDFSQVTELSNTTSSALQSYIAARTAIRDYLISVDDKYFAQVEQRVSQSIASLNQAEMLADQQEVRNAIQTLRDSIQEWGLIARRVHDAFAAYHQAVECKVVSYFDTLVHRGGVLLHTNASLATSVILDVQTANAAIAGYLMKNEERLAENAQRAINWAKEKIDQAIENNANMSPALQSFSTNLDACAAGLQEAVANRKNAFRLFHDNLAPLGTQIQSDFEEFRQQVIDYQRSISG